MTITITITGTGDDRIRVGGDMDSGEFNALCATCGGRSLLAVSDGTLLRVLFGDDEIWRITPLMHGTAQYSKVEGSKDADTDTNDIVTLEGEIKWVALASEWARA